MMIRAQNSYYLPPDGTHLITTLLNRIGSTHCYHRGYHHEGRKRHLRRPTHSKDLSKLAVLPDYRCPLMLCLGWGLVKLKLP
jgi:hypothetical protein